LYRRPAAVKQIQQVRPYFAAKDRLKGVWSGLKKAAGNGWRRAGVEIDPRMPESAKTSGPAF
jgi:hypothetical protein